MRPDDHTEETSRAKRAGMGLRGKVMSGAGHLVVRQGLGMVVSLVGLLVITRAIGPEAYGTYAAFLGVFAFTTSVSRMGVDVYLIRKIEEDGAVDLHQAFSLLLMVGAAVALFGWSFLPRIGGWLDLEDARRIGFAFIAFLPLHLVSFVPKARLERRLDYHIVAWVELGTQCIFYAVAVPLAVLGWGVGAPIGGWIAQQLFSSSLVFGLSRYRPRWHWETGRVRSMLGYGLGYASSQWIWQVRELVNPLVVGRFVGLEAVGHVALAIRLVNTLSFVKTATYRLSISSFGRIQHDLGKLRRVLAEGMRLQVLALGPFLLVFLALGPWLLPRLFGTDWLPLLDVFPFIALGSIANALFNLHSSTLYVLRRNMDVAAFHLVHVSIFAGVALALVPRLGVRGYGWAEVAALASYGVLHVLTSRRIGRPDSLVAFVWALAFGAALFYPLVGSYALLGVVVVMLWPATWRALEGYAGDVRRLVHG